MSFAPTPTGFGVTHALYVLSLKFSRLCRYGSLDQLLWGRQASIAPTLHERQQLKIMDGIAAGIAFLHKNGVCHRDLKSPNVPSLLKTLVHWSYGLTPSECHDSGGCIVDWCRDRHKLLAATSCWLTSFSHINAARNRCCTTGI